MSYESVQVTIEFISPLLHHAPAGVDPDHPIQKEIKKLTDKKTKKTEEDRERIKELEYELAIYCDPKWGPYIPAGNFETMLRDAARLTKRGRDIERGVQVWGPGGEGLSLYLKYDGPRTVSELFHDVKFRDVRAVGNQRARIMRCRPKFPAGTQLTASIMYDTSVLDKETVMDILGKAGRYIGLGDGRSIKLGRFEVIGESDIKTR